MRPVASSLSRLLRLGSRMSTLGYLFLSNTDGGKGAWGGKQGKKKMKRLNRGGPRRGSKMIVYVVISWPRTSGKQGGVDTFYIFDKVCPWRVALQKQKDRRGTGI